MRFSELKTKLPIGCQSFAQLINRGKVYVDKTAYVYELAVNDSPQILTRPRRFGKSTLLTTLEALFRYGVKPDADGKPSLFHGLAIEQLWQDEETYPVLRLNLHRLNSNCDTAAQFEQNLMRAVANFCDEQKIDLTAQINSKLVAMVVSEPLRFNDLFSYMLDQMNRPLVLLVDEFDAPLIYHYDQKQELKECKLIMRGLFNTVKDYPDKFRCVLFTGITRFQDLDLGTAGNSFTDVSYDGEFAACCGYTRAELEHYFPEYLRYAAAVRNGCSLEAVSDKQIERLLNEMSFWYDSYSFDGSEQNRVFSTWSVLRFFANKESVLDAYWSTEEGAGLPQLLKLVLERIKLNELIAELGQIVIGGKEFLQSSLINPKANPYSLLFQTGYLTFAEPFRPSGKAHLTCPNQEIRWAFANLLVRHFYNFNYDLCSSESSSKMLAALASIDPEQIRIAINEAIGILPYSHSPENEFWVAGLMILFLFGLNLKPRAEVMSLNGRADCVFDLPGHNITFVFEFKYEASADDNALDAKLAEALQQIKSRKYALDGNSESRVARLGLVFCAAPSERGFARVELADVIAR